MPINPFKKKSINFIIDDHTLRFLELDKPEPLSVKELGEKRLSEGTIHEGKINDRKLLLESISTIVSERKLRNRTIQFIVPDSLVVVRKVEIPKQVQMNEITNYLELEIGTSIHLPFDVPVFDIHLIQETLDYKEILLFAAPKDIVSEYIDVFKEAKLKVVVADVSSLALYRLYHKLKEVNQEGHILFVQHGEGTVNATIFHKHLPMFMRHFVLESTAEPDIEPYLVQEVTSELERIINFYRFTINQGNEMIARVVLSGDSTQVGQIQLSIQEGLGLPVEIFTSEAIPLSSKSSQGCEQFLSPKYYIALGLALKEV